jgi:hypothetical protein
MSQFVYGPQSHANALAAGLSLVKKRRRCVKDVLTLGGLFELFQSEFIITNTI